MYFVWVIRDMRCIIDWVRCYNINNMRGALMKFLGNIIFWSIFVIVMIPIFFYSPVVAIIILAVMVIPGVTAGVLIYIFDYKHK